MVDVSDVYERKREALACYRTQFRTDAPGAVATRLTSPLFTQLVESRDAQFGARAGVAWAEGFVVQQPPRARAPLRGGWTRPAGAAARPPA